VFVVAVAIVGVGVLSIFFVVCVEVDCKTVEDSVEDTVEDFAEGLVVAISVFCSIMLIELHLGHFALRPIKELLTSREKPH
jgi:hypothetical protein